MGQCSHNELGLGWELALSQLTGFARQIVMGLKLVEGMSEIENWVGTEEQPLVEVGRRKRGMIVEAGIVEPVVAGRLEEIAGR